jgi:hypothetical protein
MWPKWLVALLVLLREAWSARRDAHIRLLKLQAEMLKARLPGIGSIRCQHFLGGLLKPYHREAA